MRIVLLIVDRPPDSSRAVREMSRVAAMDIPSKTFARYPEQRSNFSLKQILANLEKLPVNRATARQFKLIRGGKNIQLATFWSRGLFKLGVPISVGRRAVACDRTGTRNQPEKEPDINHEGRSREEIMTMLHQLCSLLLDDAQKTLLGRSMGERVDDAIEPIKKCVDGS